MIILGSGTKLTLTTADPINENEWKLDRKGLVKAETIEDEGLNAFSIINWQEKNFSASKKLVIQEMMRYTFGKGVTVKLTLPNENNFVDLVNKPQDLSKDVIIEYKDVDDDSFIMIPQYNISDTKWMINSRLDLNIGPGTPQKLLENHTITLFKMIKTGETDVEQPGIEVKYADNKDHEVRLGINLQRSGGEHINLKLLDLGETTQHIDPYPVSAFVYNKTSIPQRMRRNDATDLIIYNVGNNELAENTSIDENIPIIVPTGKSTLIMFYWTKPEGTVTDSIILTSTEGDIQHYNKTSSDGALHEGINIIQLSDSIKNLKITINPKAGKTLAKTADILVIGTLDVINGLNLEQFGFSDDEEESDNQSADLLTKIALLGKVKEYGLEKEEVDAFFYNAKLDKSHLIEIEDISNPLALFDANNIANQFTIAQIDVDSSDKTISVVKGSLR